MWRYLYLFSVRLAIRLPRRGRYSLCVLRQSTLYYMQAQAPGSGAPALRLSVVGRAVVLSFVQAAGGARLTE